MDKRFKNIDSELNYSVNKAEMAAFFEEFDNMAMDNAFVDASNAMQYPYAPAFWQNYAAQEGQIIQHVSFTEAAQNYSASYNPAFWNEAEQALVSEGLHYQYKTDYWNEAEKLLAAADKRVFFTKWLAVASILLLIGFGGHMYFNSVKINSEGRYSNNLLANDKIIDMVDSKNNRSNSNTDRVKQKNTETTMGNAGTSIKELQNSNYKRKNLDKSASKRNPKSNGESNDQNLTKNIGYASTSDLKSNSTEKKQPVTATKNAAAQIQRFSKDKINSNKATNNNVSSNTPARIDKPSNLAVASKMSENNIPSARSRKTVIRKMSIAMPSAVSYQKEKSKPALGLIEITDPKSKNLPTIFIQTHAGIGSTFSNSDGYNERLSADLGVTFVPKKASNFSLTLQTGLDYQNLDNYINSHDIVNYERNGDINYGFYGYEFEELVKWQNTLLLGYKINQRFSTSIGIALDQYLTSGIKVHESLTDVTSISDKQWGQNDFINAVDFQIVAQLEYHLKDKLSIFANTEIGLINQLNIAKNPLMTPNRNSALTLGLKFKPFK